MHVWHTVFSIFVVMLFELVDLFCAILALRIKGKGVPICVILCTMECKYIIITSYFYPCSILVASMEHTFIAADTLDQTLTPFSMSEVCTCAIFVHLELRQGVLIPSSVTDAGQCITQ